MTNYNERLDDVLDTLVENAADSDSRLGYVEAYEHAEKAKQAITSLIKGLMVEAKPKTMPSNLSPEDYEKCERVVNQYHQNLLKALEEK